MVPGVELDRYDFEHEMSNQQSKKQCRALSFPKTTQNLIAEPYLCLTQILCQLVDFLGKSKETSIQVLRNPQLE